MANSQSHIREIADKKTAYNEGHLYLKSGTLEHTSLKFRKENKINKIERGIKKQIISLADVDVPPPSLKTHQYVSMKNASKERKNTTSK